MNLDGPSLFVSIALGCVGMGFFVYGKRQGRIPQLAVGILLAVFPYFVGNPWVQLGIAAALIAGLFVAVRFGL